MQHRLIAAGLTAALTVTGGGLAVAAQGGTSKPQRPAAVFQQRLADRLGISESRLRAATKQAATDTVGALRSGGRISAGRAAKLDRRITRAGTAGFATLGPVRRAAPARRAARAALAAALKLDPRQLGPELRSAGSPAKLIASRGADAATVRDAVRQAVRAALDKPVAAGRLTGEQADARATRVAARLTGDRPVGAGRAKPGG